MRALTVIFVLLLASSTAFGQSEPRPRPLGTVPLTEAPPPPPLPDLTPEDARLEKNTQVTTRKEGSTTYTEYRVNGRLYMVKVTPATGKPYSLIDHRGDGQFSRQELDANVRVPQWVLVEF